MNKRLIFDGKNEYVLDSRTGAPWYHYVGAMLIGWAMAALMYTY